MLRISALILGLMLFLSLFSFKSFCNPDRFVEKTIEKEAEKEQVENTGDFKSLFEVLKKSKDFLPYTVVATKTLLHSYKYLVSASRICSASFDTKQKYIFYCRLLFYE
jgi:hypothetical protein